MSKHITATNIWKIPQTSWSWRVATKIVFAHVVVSEHKHLLSDFFSKRWLCIVMRTSQLFTCLPSLWPCVWRILRMRVGRVQRPILASPARLRDSYRAERECICSTDFVHNILDALASLGLVLSVSRSVFWPAVITSNICWWYHWVSVLAHWVWKNYEAIYFWWIYLLYFLASKTLCPLTLAIVDAGPTSTMFFWGTTFSILRAAVSLNISSESEYLKLILIRSRILIVW